MEDNNRTSVDTVDLACDRYIGFVVNSLVAGLVCLLGLAGNTLSILVLRRDKNTPVASLLLKTLAVVDNVFLSFWFLHFSLNDLFAHLKIAERFHVTWWYIRVYTYPMTFVAQTGTIYMTVLIATTRFLAVCKPYKAVEWGNVTTVKKGIYMVFILSLVYNLPRFFESMIVTEAVNGTTVFNIVRTRMGRNRFYQLIYFDIMYYIFSFVLPLLLLAILNTKLIVAYRAVVKRRRGSLQLRGDRENNDHNITLVMIIVVLIFMLCNAPARVAQIIWSYNPVKCLSHGFWIMKISTVMEVLNSSINFVIYCVFRRQFRQVVRVQYCQKKQHDGQGPMTINPLLPLQETPGKLVVTCANGHAENSADV